GQYRHRAVNREQGDLPEKASPEDVIHARSVWLSSPEEHLSARIDLVEGQGQSVSPVDYKRGAVPETPEQSWEQDRLQLCAQGLVLRANGYTCEGGFIYYSSSKTRVWVQFDDALISTTRAKVRELLEVVSSGRAPPPLVDSAKCYGCSLVGICLPDETHALSMVPPDPVASQVRRLYPARAEQQPLYVQDQGS
ncbi:MAG: CRISPR-associated protein Cas4, partial [Dehalococcoidia bacterium]|nr:CRISPR-associated protein Cas4 [Dehalococcoidia bacterium]